MPNDVLNVLGDAYRTLISSAETTGGYSLVEIICRPGGGTPLHVHSKEDEAFCVLEGELTLYCDGRVIKAGPGASFHAPRNVPHRFANETQSDVRLLMFIIPGGAEAMFEAIAALPPGPPDIDALTEITARFGITLL